MRHRKKGRKFSRNTSHRRCLLLNLANSLLRFELIETTEKKAKDLRSFVERIITLAKCGDLHARRIIYRVIRNEEVLKKLFNDIRIRFKDFPGGYVRVVRSRIRKGDYVPLALVSLIQ